MAEMADPIALNVQLKFPREGELAERVLALIHEYDGELSTVSALGVLEIVKSQLIAEAA